MDPNEFAKQWPGDLRPLEFLPPRPMLPTQTVAFLHYAGLPKVFRLRYAQQIDFDFLPRAISMNEIWAAEMTDFSMPVSWARFWQIGAITYTQAKAWLCIEELTGRIVAIDVDIDDPVDVVSTSATRMMLSLKHLIDWSRATGGRLCEVVRLREALANDAELAGDAKHFLLPFIEAAIEAEWETLEIAFE